MTKSLNGDLFFDNLYFGPPPLKKKILNMFFLTFKSSKIYTLGGADSCPSQHCRNMFFEDLYSLI